MMAAFTFCGGSLSLERTYVMGILNVTPDSFSDGGRYLDPGSALAHALEMERLGANIIDVGAQSTRPGYTQISPHEEWERLAPVLRVLLDTVRLPISVDTFYPQVAERALLSGAHIINDVSGFGDEMLRAAAGSGCGCIVMHPGLAGAATGSRPDILGEVRAFFQDRLEAAERLGIDHSRLCFDPGIGFGKSYEDNLRLIANVSETRIPGCAYLMAASRKRVTGEPCGNPPFEERLAATLAAHTVAVMGGADIVRVHDVKEGVQAARMADALKSQLSRNKPGSSAKLT